jgi:hypothetical protein
MTARMFNEVLKDAGLSDVHVPGGGKRKARTFAQVRAEQTVRTAKSFDDALADMRKGFNAEQPRDADGKWTAGGGGGGPRTSISDGLGNMGGSGGATAPGGMPHNADRAAASRMPHPDAHARMLAVAKPDTAAWGQQTAGRSAVNKMRALRTHAERGDIAAIQAIPTSRSNTYQTRADDYKQALLNAAGMAGTSPPVTNTRGPRNVQRIEDDQNLAAMASRNAASAAAQLQASQARAAAAPPPAVTPEISPAANRVGEAPRMPLGIKNPAALARANRIKAALEAGDLAAVRANARPASSGRNSKEVNAYADAAIAHLNTPEMRANAERMRAEAKVRAAKALQREAEGRASANARVDAELNSNKAFRTRAVVGANIHAVKVTGSDLHVMRMFGDSHDKNTLRRLGETMIADYPGTTFAMSMTVTEREAAISFQGRDGTSIRRTFSRNNAGELTVYHAYFKAGRQGNGAGKEFFRTSMGVYQSLGVKEVGVTANIDVGMYAWAKYGFTPEQAGWRRVKEHAAAKLRSLQMSRSGSDIMAADAAKLRSILSSNDPRSMWKLADAKTGDRSIGKELILGGPSWSGTIKTDDAVAMRRYTDYVTRPTQGGR